MLDQRRVATQPDENREQLFREQLFIERYESLRALALRLSSEVDAADDLVQDLFVQWVLSRTRLEEIENIDGYLRTMLRYMHFARMSRSAQRRHETALSIADYDSCHFGWTALEPPRRMQASEDLHQICVYACSRKESSKAGSVLILRFFHNYFPTEIATVLNSSRNCIDQWQRVARREAKLFMNEPRRLRFVDSKTSSERHQIKYLRPDGDLMLDLRQMIFNSCHGDCLSRHELEEIYSAGQTDALSTAKLAHIVSCPGCLDAVNRMLSLPLLAERYRNDIAEHKEPPSDAAGGGASGSGPGEFRKKFARRLRETHEHKPQELRIAVNGFLVSTLKISSELSELDLNLTPDEPIEFVEVSSEQGVQLLFFSVNPTRRQDEQWAWIELSEGRCLEACYQDETGPTLHMVYKDPVPAEAYATAENPNALSSPLFAVPAVNELNEPSVGARGAVANARSWVVRLFKTLRNTAGQGVSAEETKNQSTEETLASSLAGPTDGLPFLKLLSQAEDRARSPRRLGLLVVLVSAALIAGFLFFKANLSHPLTATVLLEQAGMAERDRTVDVVKHRFINLEERRSVEGAVVARHKIEIWSNNAKGENVQRLYDDSNRLVAAAWQKAGGSHTVYHHGLKPQTQPALVTPENLLLSLEDVWQLEPSPETFGKVIVDTSAADVEERSTTYVLRFEKGRTIGASNLLKATLTLSKSDLHSIEQTLLVQRGNELREYRFVEASFELVPLRNVARDVFEIEPELTGGAGELGRPGDWALRDLTASRIPPRPARRHHPQLPQNWKSTSHTCSIRQRPTGTSKSPSRAVQVGRCALRELSILNSERMNFCTRWRRSVTIRL